MPAVKDLRDPVATIRKLMVDNWDPANTPDLSSRPEISTGWWNSDDALPQVTITGRDDPAKRATATGWTAISADGSGPVREVAGQVTVRCWAAFGTDPTSRGADPRKLRHQMGREVARIITLFADGDDAATEDLESLGFDGPTDDESRDDADRMVFVAIYRISYEYALTP